ncbi:MAG: hypothetical protein GTO71_10720 [Woeseiaceae bacterium]|nr:hypothetical protein [Woeseiaceae bacterium]NIP21547.1 hypothetical protein [Woeseiaceae bacterium]NIS90535.1 hypothetical protein [Woeseiaceae bacterium]
MTEEIRAPKRPVLPPQRAATALLNRRWVSLLAELVLIVAGILIALYIDGWVQDRQDRDREVAYLELLRDDLILIEAEVAQFVEFEKSMLATGKEFLDAISTANPTTDHRPLHGMLGELSVRRTLSIVSAAYADLTNTGNLQLIGNSDLRRQLVRYFADIERSELIVEKNTTRVVDEIFKHFLMDAGVTIYIDQTVLPPIERANAVLLDVLGPDFTWPRDVVLQQPRRSSSWDEFRRQVLYRMRIAAGGRVTGERLIESTQQLRALVEEELARRDSRQ